VFGVLIGATDPIAVIALLRESGVTGRSSLLIEAESLLNDGAAAVFFALILAWAAHDP
jgi:CPA1 family monovalent cation:H+ antiporter